MNLFYLNNLVGTPRTVADGAKALRDVFVEYGKLKKIDGLNICSTVVMDKAYEDTHFGEFYLKQLVAEIKDRDERRYALQCLHGTYPMDQAFPSTDEDWLHVGAEYQYKGTDATTLAITYLHKGLLLTIPFSEEWRTDQVTVNATQTVAKTPSAITITSLYGEESNTEHVRNELAKREGVRIQLIDKLKAYGAMNRKFERDFNALTIPQQESIIDAFAVARQQGLIIPEGATNAIRPNDELVRSQTGTKKEKIFEIAVYHPLALRIFIAQDKGKLYILSIGLKKDYKDDHNKAQNRDLREAEKKFIAMKAAKN